MNYFNYSVNKNLSNYTNERYFFVMEDDDEITLYTLPELIEDFNDLIFSDYDEWSKGFDTYLSSIVDADGLHEFKPRTGSQVESFPSLRQTLQSLNTNSLTVIIYYDDYKCEFCLKDIYFEEIKEFILDNYHVYDIETKDHDGVHFIIHIL